MKIMKKSSSNLDTFLLRMLRNCMPLEVCGQIALCSTFWGKKVFLSTSSTIMRTIPEASCQGKAFFLARHCWHKHLRTKNRKKRVELARKFIQGAAWNMVMNLNYYNRRGKDLQDIIDTIKRLSNTLPDAKTVDEIMGIEGNIRQAYYAAFDIILDDFNMGSRTKQPPENEVNALISFGNMMCYTETLRAVHQTQLNPTISFLHTPGERRFSLCLDISEIFKPIIVDRVIFKVLNKHALSTSHFDKKLNKCLLNEKGKKIFVKAMEERYDETFRHRSLGRNVSYKHLIKLECYKLLKDILGIEEYKPFKMYW